MLCNLVHQAEHQRHPGLWRSNIRMFAVLCILCCALVVQVGEARADPPWNDNIGGAFNIRPNLNYFSGKMDQATLEAGEPGFENGEAANRSVWFKHRASADGYLVLLSITGASPAAPGVGIDVFRGRSFDPADRIASAYPEDFLQYTKVSRVVVPVIREEMVYIRVAAVGFAEPTKFSLNVIHANNEGELILLPVRNESFPRMPFLFYGEIDCCLNANFRNLFVFVNTTTQPALLGYAKYDLPSSVVFRGGDRIAPRSGSRPGLQWISIGLDWDNAHRGESGAWNYKVVARVAMGASTKRFAVRIPFVRARSGEARVVMSADNTRLSAVLGNTTRAEVRVQNTSRYMAKGCRFVRPRVGPPDFFAPTEFRWRRLVPPSPINAAVDIPAGATRRFEILLNTNFAGFVFGARFDFACENAVLDQVDSPDFWITSRP